MNIASVKLCDCANGPGMRTSVFVSGCRRHCPGCFNEVAWDFEYGEPLTEELFDYIIESLEETETDGLTVLGGEPFEQENIEEVNRIVSFIKRYTPTKNKTIWVYTGFTFEMLVRETYPALYDISISESIWEILRSIDVLVDGPFIESQKDISLAFRGSRNQRIIDVQASLKKGEVVLMEEYM